MVFSSSKDLTKRKYTVWSEMEYVIFWQAVRVVKETLI